MSVYDGGASGSGNTHMPQVNSGGKKMAKGKGTGAKGKSAATSGGGGRSPAAKSLHPSGSVAQKAVHKGSSGAVSGGGASAAQRAITNKHSGTLPQGRGQNR